MGEIILEVLVYYSQEQMMNILMHLPSWNGKMPIPCILKPKPLWSGEFSIVLRKIDRK